MLVRMPRQAPLRRRRPRSLSRDRILAAAIAVADAEGIGAVTMRRVAQALGVEAMSLYNHVPGKDALLDGMIDALVDELGVPADTEDWKASIHDRARSGRAMVRRHPWAPALFAARPRVRLPLMIFLDGVMGTLLGAGFSPQLAHTALHVLDSRILGFTRDLFDPAGQPAPDAAFLEALGSGTMPHAARIVAEATHDEEAEFAFALDLILDGLEQARERERAAPDASPDAKTPAPGSPGGRLAGGSPGR